LGAPFHPGVNDGTEMHDPPVNVAWGILSTPVVDLDASAIYLTNWSTNDAGVRELRLHALSLRDGTALHPSLKVEASQGPVSLQPNQKQRAALLLTPLRGSARKMLYIG